jgi:hypothetical protein
MPIGRVMALNTKNLSKSTPDEATHAKSKT